MRAIVLLVLAALLLTGCTSPIETGDKVRCTLEARPRPVIENETAVNITETTLSNSSALHDAFTSPNLATGGSTIPVDCEAGRTVLDALRSSGATSTYARPYSQSVVARYHDGLYTVSLVSTASSHA